MRRAEGLYIAARPMNMQRSTTAAKSRAGPKACLNIVPEADVVVTEIASLQTLSHAELKQRWQDMFGTPVPHNMSKRLLIHALAYDLQGQSYGGLKKPAKQMLADAIAATCLIGTKQPCLPLTQSDDASADVEGASSDTSPLNNESALHTFIAAGRQYQASTRTPPPAIILSPGTRLMREWRGVVQVVDAVEGGFMWNGKVHGSLSAIARAITGVRWNGLAFFGLRKRKDSHPPRPNKSHHPILTDIPLLSSTTEAPDAQGVFLSDATLLDEPDDAMALLAPAPATGPLQPQGQRCFEDLSDHTLELKRTASRRASLRPSLTTDPVP